MPVVFISYSHDSDDHRERVAALAQRLRLDGFDTRLDQFVGGGPPEGWPRWMMDQLDAAHFVLLVCTETYYRRFRGHEVPGKGKGVNWEGALITSEIYHARSKTLKFVPLLFSAADEAFIPEPLRGQSHYSPLTADGYAALVDFLAGRAGVEPVPVGPLVARPRKTVAPLAFASDRRIAPSRLPKGAPTLFGREAELARLEHAWRDPAQHVLTVVAWGGVGKSALLVRWVADLAARDFDGADYFDWSFYSQGTRDHSTASGDEFVDKALRFFGDETTADSRAGAWDKGSRLAALVAARKTLLVLDGLEPLQHGEGSPLEGELKDPGVKALLKGLALRNAGLCVVTTRERVANLDGMSTVQEVQLDRLSVEAGLALLKSLGVDGSATDLEKLVTEVRGHALTLSLLGTFLRDAHGGDVRRRDLVKLEEADANLRGGHAFRVMEAYEKWFESAGAMGRRDLAVLRLLGLFDRAASAGCLAALRKEPAIAGLTAPLFDGPAGWRGWFTKKTPISDTQWSLCLARLATRELVTTADDGSVDAHPLISQYFATRLDRAAWREAHGRLFDFLQDKTEQFPDTLAGLQPLYQAVYHGCQAGRWEEACVGVYRDRILRGGEAFSTFQLGAIGADLGAVACFFEKPWSQVASTLSEGDQAWLLNEAATRLRALGRLREAVEPMRAVLNVDVDRGRWKEAAISANNLSELELTLGEVAAAVADAEQSVVFADRSGDAFERMSDRTTLADARHQAGEEGAALELFREAERLQAERQPPYPLLYSLSGFRYCELLLAPVERAAGSGRDARAPRGGCDEVERRAAKMFEWRLPGDSLLDIALDHLSLGRARLYRAILEGRGSEGYTEARDAIEKAVAGLRAAGSAHHLPRGLLTRAWLRFAQGDTAGAREDLDEAQEIAERGSMRLFLADVALYRARFFHDRAALAEAKRLVEECGYGRRLPEIEDLESAVKARL